MRHTLRLRVLLPTPTTAALAPRLATGRTVMAAVILAAPVASARLLGADTATAQRVTWLTRMAGVRDGVLGVGALDSLRRDTDINTVAGTNTAVWLLGGSVADAVDAAVLASALRQGRLRGPVPTAVAIGAAASAVLHALAAARSRRG